MPLSYRNQSIDLLCKISLLNFALQNLHEYFGSRSHEFELHNLLEVRSRSRLKNFCLLVPVFHNTGDILYHKHTCKYIYKCSCLYQLNYFFDTCKYIYKCSCLYQLNYFFELDTQEIRDGKTCTDLLQK